MVKYITPILYVQKNEFDKKFFKKLDEQRLHKSSIPRKLSQFVSNAVIAGAGVGVMIKLVESEDGVSIDVESLKHVITHILATIRRDGPMCTKNIESRKGLSLKALFDRKVVVQ